MPSFVIFVQKEQPTVFTCPLSNENWVTVFGTVEGGMRPEK